MRKFTKVYKTLKPIAIFTLRMFKKDAMRSNHFIYLGSGLAVLGSLYFLSGFSFPNIFIGVLTFLGAVLAGVSAFLYQSSIKSNEEENEEDSVLLLKTLKELMDKNSQLTYELNQYKEQHSYSISHAFVIPIISPNGNLGFKAQKHGGGLIDDLSIEIIDLEKLVVSEIPGVSTIEDFRFASNFFHIGQIPAKEVILPETEISLYGEQRSFDITIYTRQGRIIEYLRMYRIDTDWKMAIRIKNEINGHIIYETIDPEINKKSLEW